MSSCCRQRALYSAPRLIGTGIASLCLGFVGTLPTLLPDEDFGKNARKVDHRGIANERAYYFEFASLMAMSRDRKLPNNRYAQEGRKLAENKVDVHYAASVGYTGYLAGPDTHIIDLYALTDPLLARMPAQNNKSWRIGHVVRYSPKGYRQTIRSGESEFAADGVGQYYDALRTITQGPIWSTRDLLLCGASTQVSTMAS